MLIFEGFPNLLLTSRNALIYINWPLHLCPCWMQLFLLILIHLNFAYAIILLLNKVSKTILFFLVSICDFLVLLFLHWLYLQDNADRNRVNILPNLGGKAFCSLPWKTLTFFYALIRLRKFPPVSSLLAENIFYGEWLWNFITCIVHIFTFYCMVFILWFTNVNYSNSFSEGKSTLHFWSEFT